MITPCNSKFTPAARLLLVGALPLFFSYQLGRLIESQRQQTLAVVPAPTAAVSTAKVPPELVRLQQKAATSRLTTDGVGISYILDGVAWQAELPKCLIIHTGGGVIVVHYDTGKVDLPPGQSLDTSAREFWRAVEQAFPHTKP